MKDSQKCLACSKPITGRPSVMRLQITHDNAKLIDRAKQLGFASETWKEGDSLKGVFDKKCFDTAIFIWQVAFHTRLLSPRR